MPLKREGEMVEVSVRIVAPPTKRAEILDVLRCLKGPTEVSRGCVSCRLFGDEEDERVLIYRVRWESLDALEVHLRSDRFRTLLPYIEMSPEPPEVEFTTIEVFGGIEFLVDVLAAKPK
jgi:quinol monooxygenase YgiN